MQDMAQVNQHVVKQDVENDSTIDYKKIGFISLAALLGGGRILSNIALVNQGMQQTFFLLGLKESPWPQLLSGIAALANGTSDSITRFTAIYNGLIGFFKNWSDNAKNDFVEPKTSYSSMQSAVYYSIMTLGVLDMTYFVLNNFSAIIQLECQYLNNTHCQNGFDWPHITPFIPAAVICSLSTGIAFAAFSLTSIHKNAKDFIDYFSKFSNNISKENKLILAGISVLGLANALSLGATLFFSTSKMTYNLFGPNLSKYKIIQAQVYIAIVASIIGSIFSWVAEGKKLLQCEKAGLRNWFCHDGNDFYLMSSFPEGKELEKYLNNYILCDEKLGYVSFDKTFEIVKINNFHQLSGEINNITQGEDVEKLHLSSQQCKELITSNGGHTPHNSLNRKFFSAILVPILIANVASHALNNFPGNVEILDKIFSGYERLKIGFAIGNSLNTAFLYYAFNTGKALSIAAGVSNDIQKDDVPVENKKYTPATLLLSKNRFFSGSVQTKNLESIIDTNTNEERDIKSARGCPSCTLF